MSVEPAFQQQVEGIRCVLSTEVGQCELLVAARPTREAERSSRVENTAPITRFNIGTLCE